MVWVLSVVVRAQYLFQAYSWNRAYQRSVNVLVIIRMSIGIMRKWCIHTSIWQREKKNNHCIANGVLNERLFTIAALALSTPQSSNKNIIVLFRTEYRKHRQPYFSFRSHTAQYTTKLNLCAICDIVSYQIVNKSSKSKARTRSAQVLRRFFWGLSRNANLFSCGASNNKKKQR